MRNRNLNASDDQINNPVVADNEANTSFNETGDAEENSEKVTDEGSTYEDIPYEDTGY